MYSTTGEPVGSVAFICIIKLYFNSITKAYRRADEGLVLETRALYLYGGQFALTKQFIKLNTSLTQLTQHNTFFKNYPPSDQFELA